MVVERLANKPKYFKRNILNCFLDLPWKPNNSKRTSEALNVPQMFQGYLFIFVYCCMHGVFSIDIGGTFQMIRAATVHYPLHFSSGVCFTQECSRMQCFSGLICQFVSVNVDLQQNHSNSWVCVSSVCEALLVHILKAFPTPFPIDQSTSTPGNALSWCPLICGNYARGCWPITAALQLKQGQFRRPTDALTAFCYANFKII